MLNWLLFRLWNGWFFYVRNEKNVAWGKFERCTNRNYVLTDFVLFKSVKYVSQCYLIVDHRFLRWRVNQNYVLTAVVRTKRKWLHQRPTSTNPSKNVRCWDHYRLLVAICIPLALKTPTTAGQARYFVYILCDIVHKVAHEHVQIQSSLQNTIAVKHGKLAKHVDMFDITIFV